MIVIEAITESFSLERVNSHFESSVATSDKFSFRKFICNQRQILLSPWRFASKFLKVPTVTCLELFSNGFIIVALLAIYRPDILMIT